LPSFMNSRFSRLVLAASVLVWTACSGKKGVTNPPNTTPSITVVAGSPTLSVAQSASGTSALTVGRTNFTGDVTLTAENLPTGVTATFTPATVTAGGTASSVAFAASGTAASGVTTQITVRARGTGVSDATAPIALTVSVAVGGTVSLALTPASASITAGQTAATVVAITRSGGFTGGVNFTVTGAPPGMTTTFSSANPVTAGTVNLSAATLASVTPGVYTLKVRANAAGLTEATADFAVTVGAPPSNSVTWRFCDPARIPLWFAYQDGLTGSWQRVTETTPGVYTFAYGQPQVGVTTVTNEGSKVVTEVSYYGLSEVTAVAASECTDNPAPGTKTLSGTISGFTNPQEIALVSMGAALSNSANQTTPAFTITKVPSGAVDLIAIRANLVTSSVQRMLLTRGTNFATGASLGTLDLAAGTSFAPGTGSITVTAPNDGALFATNVFTTITGSSAALTTPQLSSGVAATYQGVPDANLIASDLQEVQVTQQVGSTLSRFLTRFTRGPTTLTLAMPADPGAPTVTSVSGASYARATTSGSLPAAFNSLISLSFDQASPSRRWDIASTAAGRTGTLTYSFTMPDFTALAGWQSSWALAAGTTAVTSTFFGQTGANPDGTPTTGTTIFTFGRLGSFTFP
jgi:hypothetical protein